MSALRNRFIGREVRVIVHQRFTGFDGRPGRRGWAVKPKLKVWVVFGDRVKLGDGRAQLLELIDELGSLRKAVARLEMSYRNAWGYLRELEHAAGFKLLERHVGGGPGRGMRLTKRGKEFVTRYRQFRRQVDAGVDRQFARTFRTR